MCMSLMFHHHSITFISVVQRNVAQSLSVGLLKANHCQSIVQWIKHTNHEFNLHTHINLASIYTGNELKSTVWEIPSLLFKVFVVIAVLNLDSARQSETIRAAWGVNVVPEMMPFKAWWGSSGAIMQAVNK